MREMLVKVFRVVCWIWAESEAEAEAEVEELLRGISTVRASQRGSLTWDRQDRRDRWVWASASGWAHWASWADLLLRRRRQFRPEAAKPLLRHRPTDLAALTSTTVRGSRKTTPQVQLNFNSINFKYPFPNFSFFYNWKLTIEN